MTVSAHTDSRSGQTESATLAERIELATKLRRLRPEIRRAVEAIAGPLAEPSRVDSRPADDIVAGSVDLATVNPVGGRLRDQAVHVLALVLRLASRLLAGRDPRNAHRASGSSVSGPLRHHLGGAPMRVEKRKPAPKREPIRFVVAGKLENASVAAWCPFACGQSTCAYQCPGRAA